MKIPVLRTWFLVPISQRNEIDSATTQQKSPEAIEKYTMRNKGGGEKTQRPGTEGHLIRMATSSNLRSSDKTPWRERRTARQTDRQTRCEREETTDVVRDVMRLGSGARTERNPVQRCSRNRKKASARNKRKKTKRQTCQTRKENVQTSHATLQQKRNWQRSQFTARKHDHKTSC